MYILFFLYTIAAISFIGIILWCICFIISQNWQKQKKWTEDRKSPDLDISKNLINTELITAIQSFPTTDIERIRFCENTGKTFSFDFESVKQIAKYIEFKYHKTLFGPNELEWEKEFLIENYAPTLPKEEHNHVICALSDFVTRGGKFDIIMRK